MDRSDGLDRRDGCDFVPNGGPDSMQISMHWNQELEAMPISMVGWRAGEHRGQKVPRKVQWFGPPLLMESQ
jgi:hypothetical protein